MSNDIEEERIPPRRPFTFDIKDSKMIDVIEAYKEADKLVFKKPEKKKRKFL